MEVEIQNLLHNKQTSTINIFKQPLLIILGFKKF